MATSMSFPKTQRKIILLSILNKHFLQTHVKLEINVLSIAKKLMKDVVHLWSKNKQINKSSYFCMLFKQQKSTIGFQGITRANS
jgi:hypothetical protein